MITYRFCRFLTAFFLFIFISFSGFAQNTSYSERSEIHKTLINKGTEGVQLKYSIPAYTRADVSSAGQVWQYIHINGAGKMREPGKPALPALTELVAIPFNSNVSVQWESESYSDYSGFTIHPALQAAFDTYGVPDPEFEIDSVLYSTDAFFPEHAAEIVDTILMRGMRVAVVQIRPVQYNPARGIIRVHQGISVRLSFNGLFPTFEPLAEENSAFYLSKLAGSLLNGSSLPAGNTHNMNPQRADYLIITINDFLAAADSIATWRRQMGYQTLVISKASWTAAQVKDTVHARFQSWLPRPDYLLILGDHNHVPAQMFSSGNNQYPTDLYFVCMDGSADHFPDMAKGRISISSASEAMNVARKIINYERNPVIDSSFYQNALHCAQFQDDDTTGYASRRFTHTSEDVRDYITSKGYDVQRIYHTYNYITPTNYNNGFYSNGDSLPSVLLRSNGFLWNGNESDIAQAINSGKFYVLHRDHGYVGGGGWAHPYFTKVSMNQLGNGNKLPVVFSINCHTGEFSLAECFAERFIRLPNGGAAGVFAASFASYSGYNDALTAGFFDAIWNNPGILPVFGSGGVANPSVSSHPPILAMGDVLNHGLLRMVQTWNGSANSNRYQQRLFHYFGDPAMRLFTTAPAILLATIPDTIIAGSTAISIQSLNTLEVMTSAVYDNQLIGSTILQTSNSHLHFSAVNDTNLRLIITLSKNNYRPLIKEVIIVSHSPALNDHPCNATGIPVRKYCETVSGSFVGAGTSSPAAPGCAISNNKDVWFHFTAPASGKAEAELHALAGLGLAAYSGNCNNPVIIDCDTLNSITGKLQLNLYSLSPGDTILLRAWQNSATASATFELCVREPDTFAYANLPYFTGFENGIDMYWEAISSNSNGRIRIDSVCDARYGNASLLMDQIQANIYAQNEVRLRLNLRDKQNVKLKFWWREYGDENHAQDGLFFSDDGGDTFVKVADFRGSFEAWTQYLLDVDKLSGLHGLKLTESFIIKFQQYDNWYFLCSNPTGGDGFAFDDIHVYIDTTSQLSASIPYYTGFEDGFDQYWTLNSSRQEGRIVATATQSPYMGNYHMTMDLSSGSNYVHNTADLRLNLTGLPALVLSFRWKSIGDESHTEDGVFFSDNAGESFKKVMSLTDTNTYWSHKNLNINALASAYNLNPGPEFVIRFSQYDNASMTADGFAFDEVEVYQSTFPIIELSNISLSFSADTGSSHSRNMRILNPGTDTLTIDSLSIPYAYQSNLSTPLQLLPGDSFVVNLNFVPDSVGSFTGYVRFYHNAPLGLDSLWLSGLGMYRELIPSLTAVMFDTIPIQTADTIEFNVTNAGNGTIRLTTVNVPSGFTLLSSQNVNVAPGQSRPVRIRFAPFLPNTYAGMVVINSDANTLNIPITGMAVNINSLEEHSNNAGFFISPNPFSDFLRIDNPGKEAFRLSLFDASGRLLKTLDCKEDLLLDLRHLSAGIYLLEMETIQQTARTKLVKQ